VDSPRNHSRDGAAHQEGGCLLLRNAHDRGEFMYTAQQRPTNWILISTKVFSGTVPFSNVQSITSIVKISDGERPPRPTNPLFTDEIWALTRQCWDQKPESRPEMSTVLRDLAPCLLQCLYNCAKSSPEFQVALSQFYDSTERKSCISGLHGAKLKEFINFLEDVRQPFKPFRSRSRL
jgi:hypothetical protein